jgi:serine protease Do
MSNNILRLMGRTIYLILFCQSFTLPALAAGQTNITGTWNMNHLESDQPDQNVSQIVAGRGALIDSAADQRVTTREISYDRILLMMDGISSPPEKLTVALTNSDITLSDREGASLALHTDGRVENFPGGIQIISRWVNETLIIATLSPETSTKTTFTTARDGGRMLVVSEADFPGVGPVVTRYLYDYESARPAFSWQLRSPIYRRESRRIGVWDKESKALLKQINNEITKALMPRGGVLDSLAFLSDQPAPPGPFKPSLSKDIPEQPLKYRSNPLRAFDSDLRALTDRVSPAVVQVLVDRYSTGGSENRGQTALVTEENSVGSGVIIDPSGYIITNAHVVKGAWRVRVILTKPAGHSDVPLRITIEESVLQATIVGGSDYFDLALLKVDASNLPNLSFADFREVGQGQIVVAVGSPLGLKNSVTMGIISSVARQVNPNSPLVYVQTDAPINPGNSGGALVDVNGRLVGINTSIFSQSGGSEGVGFALPVAMVKMVYENLRTKGYVGRRTIGVGFQPITPVLAKGLSLGSINGLLVCDVLPGTPGEQSGLKIGDLVVEADSRPISSGPDLDSSIYDHDLNQPLSLAVMRGSTRLTLQVKIVEEEDWTHSTIGPVDPAKNFIQQLGVIGATLTPALADEMGGVRVSSGVVVIGRTSNSSRLDLSQGDIIHAVNREIVRNVEVLRELVAQFKPGDPVVLLVERQAGLGFISFEMD